MSAYFVSPDARADLVSIWRYYAVEVGDVDLADRIRAELVQGYHKLAQSPGLGHFRGDLADEPLRFCSLVRLGILCRPGFLPASETIRKKADGSPSAF